MLEESNTLVVVVDIQEKLVKAVNNYNDISKKGEILSQIAQNLSLPVIVTEQYPKGLGCTIDKIKNNLTEATYIEKSTFSAYSNEDFKKLVDSYSRKNIIISGIETHICVCQTAIDLKNAGYEVFLLTDVTASRQDFEYLNGIETLKQFGIKTLTIESFLFFLLKSSKHPKFKELQKLII